MGSATQSARESVKPYAMKPLNKEIGQLENKVRVQIDDQLYNQLEDQVQDQLLTRLDDQVYQLWNWIRVELHNETSR